MLFVSLTEFILYICFSVLIGSLILFLVPENKKPSMHIPKKVLFVSAGVIPIASFLPIFRTAKLLTGDMDFGFILKSVILTFEIGKAWMLITILSILLILVLLSKNLLNKTHVKVWALVLSLIILLSYTRSSHAATITEWQGFLFHSLHFIAITIWIGILFVVSWFSRNKDNWLDFLKWFTPVALTCLIITIVAGYFTMEIDIDSYDDPSATIFQEYQNSLIFDYGQALVIKHIFIISLVLFAFLNGIILRKKSADMSFNPLKWTRIESVYALIVFGLTAFMGQSWPPHEIYNLVKTDGPSLLFDAFYPGDIVPTIQENGNFTLSFSFDSYVLFGLGILFMMLTFLAATKKRSVFVSTLASLLMVLSIYFGIMTGIQ